MARMRIPNGPNSQLMRHPRVNPYRRGGGLASSVIARAADGSTATIKISGTLASSVPTRGTDGTTATVRIT